MALSVIGLLSMAGCVSLPANTPRSPRDPWESWNRGVYKFNDRLDRAVAKPVARAYVKVVPKFIRIGVNNVFSNLETPDVMVNDALQGKWRAAGNDLCRFVLNSTIGLAGILDPATPAGLDRNNEDFGQTLGKWGTHSGPFMELPIFGPSDLRDGPARIVDTYLNPRQYIKNDWIKYGLYLPDFTDRRAALLPLDPAIEKAYDPYVFVRDAYLQRRAYLVSDGQVDNDESFADPSENTDPTPPDTSSKRDDLAPPKMR